jgi:methylthioribose-1-phosphate isomerase
MAPTGVLVENPAFDVTPARYITAIITERGVATAPFLDSLQQLSDMKPVLA